MNLDRNLLIEAGAGTGKTTTLVKGVLHALFIKELPIHSMVALTFTNKAAGELKERIAQSLQEIGSAQSLDQLKANRWWPSTDRPLKLSHLQELAHTAFSGIERAMIGTIHSFAYTLVQRYPLETGINPNAQIDEKGLRFDELFQQEWRRWLSIELGENAPFEKEWLEILEQVSLAEIEELARPLADFLAPIESFPVQADLFADRLNPLYEELSELISRCGSEHNAGKIASACQEILRLAKSKAWSDLASLPRDTWDALTLTPSETKRWPLENVARLRQFQKLAENLRRRSDHLVASLARCLAPFIQTFRPLLLAEGVLSHNALLYLARDLVHKHPHVRNTLKRDIRMIFVDEFQDTDPLQAELLLYLAEQTGPCAARWQDVQLETGKLFIVADPKQSIYRFRGADITAYQQLAERLMEQGGQKEALQINYRSREPIIHCVNAAFEKLIQEHPLISPPYIPVLPQALLASPPTIPLVELWLATSHEPLASEEAQTVEAEHIAQWIGKASVSYRDIALIFRSYNPMPPYIEALRNCDIPFVVESERYFYSTPEVTAFINLLQAIDDPSNTLALASFLRSSLGGVTDREILELKQAGCLDATRPLPPDKRSLLLENAWSLIQNLHDRIRREPLSRILHDLFENTFILEWMTRSLHGDQALSNLFKLRRLLEASAARGTTSLSQLLTKVRASMEDDRREGESPLADETYEAVRLLTIHKAKGLEFPYVFLPSLHSGKWRGPTDPITFDWRTQTLGIRIGRKHQNFDKWLLDQRTREHEAAEENRLLYVAMTRAKEKLILSGGFRLKDPNAGSPLSRLLKAWGLSKEDLTSGTINVGKAPVKVSLLNAHETQVVRPLQRPGKPMIRISPESFAEIWKRREEEYQKAMETPVVMSATDFSYLKLSPQCPLATRRGERVGVRGKGVKNDGVPKNTSRSGNPHPRLSLRSALPSPTLPRGVGEGTKNRNVKLLGTLVHQFLELWDFHGEKCSMPAQLRICANNFFANLGLLTTPFPDPKQGTPSFKPDDPMAELAEIVEEAQRILADFIGSEAYQEIAGSTILGREVPFFYAPGEPELIRGRMDILYRLPNGQLVIGDYKTDQVSTDASLQKEAPKSLSQESTRGEDVFEIGSKYLSQSFVYQEAVHRALGGKPLFKVIYLRSGQSVELCV